MDVATILGLFLGWGALITCLYMEGGAFGQMVNLPAFLLVFLGSIGASAIGYEFRTILCVPRMLRSIIIKHLPDPSKMLDEVVDMARIARIHGILALDDVSMNVNDQFIKKGIQLVIDGTPSMIIRDVMETEIAALQERHKHGESFFSAMGGYSPTMGIIGTVVGLINMLAHLEAPDQMGHAIGAAFMATLYGVAFANLLYLPIASKLKARTIEEIRIKEMTLEGILAIQAGESPRSIENRMLPFLPPETLKKRNQRYRDYNEDIRIA